MFKKSSFFGFFVTSDSLVVVKQIIIFNNLSVVAS